MPVAPVFDRDIPAPTSTSFVNGERALAVASTISSEAVGVYFLSKWVNLKPGVYNIKLFLSPGGTFTIGGTTITGNGLITTQIDVPKGNQRIDIWLNKTSVGQSAYAAFLIFRSDSILYASNASGWVFDSTDIANGNVPAPTDPRLLLPVFGVLPNWKDGISERVSYLTDIMESQTGAEQRRSLREYPRRSIEVGFLRDALLRARLDTFIVGVGTKNFLVPLWQEQYRSPSGLSINESFHQFPTTGDATLAYREFQPDTLVLVTLGDPANQEVLIVDTIDATSGRLNWRTRPTKAWPAGTRLIPLRTGFIQDRVGMSNTTDRVGSIRIRFDIHEPDTRFAGDWGYCSPLWRFKINRGSAVSVDYDRIVYAVDNTSGPVVLTNPGDRALINSRFRVLTTGRRAFYEMRQFLAAAKGRAVRFYAPTFTHDIVPAYDIEGLFFDAEVAGFAEVMLNPQWARKMVAIVLKGDAPTIYRNIIGVSVEDGLGKKVERFIVDEALPPIAFSKIERIQFIVPSRFDQDTFELTHHVDGYGAVEIGLTTRSVDGTGMPAIECYTTSTQYPLESLESLNVGLVPSESFLRGEPVEIEGLNTALVPTTSTLVMPLVTAEPVVEGLDTALVPTSGVLVMPLVTAEPFAEGLNTIMTPANGTLESIYVSYTMDSEALNTGMTPTTGVMSVLYTFDMLDVGWDDTEAAWDDLGDI